MKRYLFLLGCLSMLLLISACTKDNTMSSQPDIESISISESSLESSDDSRIDTQSELSSQASHQSLLEEAQGPTPDFLDAEQQVLYRKAKTAYMQFNMENDGFGSVENDTQNIESDGIEYYKSNGLITTWADFEDTMLSIFTSEYFEELNSMPSYTDENGVFHKRTAFVEHNGDLYFSPGARGGNMTFVEPETFELEAQSDNEIRFYVVGTYDDFAYDKDGNVIPTEDGDYERAGNATQEKYSITLKKGSDGWRFSEFNLAY